MKEEYWRQNAACKGENSAVFFDGFQKLKKPEKLDVLAICENCKVRRHCYEYAVETEAWGIWAGKLFRRGNPYNPLHVVSRSPLDFDSVEKKAS